MGRGKKHYTLDEQLEKITNEISTMELSLLELKKTKNDIEEQIKMNRLTELDMFISEKGLTFDEVKEILSKE